MADKLDMSTQKESLSQWFQEVIQPQLETLGRFGKDLRGHPDFDVKGFFKGLLADLELLGLDNVFVENCAEKIIDGARTLRDERFNLEKVDLRELAMIALLKNRFDRTLFKSYWSDYIPLTKKHKDLKDESIVNAYKVSMHCEALIAYITTAEIGAASFQGEAA